YYRSTLNRHFREPAPAVSDSMTEDGAVFGGQNNLHEGLENAYAIYKPKMMAIFTSCMPEVIGDDLTAFIKNAKQKNCVPKDLPLPYANTPSFNGTHIHGYDSMLVSILQTLTEGKQIEGRCTGKLNLIAGCDFNTGDYREYKRILETFGWIKDNYSGKHVTLPMPMGIEKTDAFIMKVAELFGKEVPESLRNERGRAVDAITDSHQYIHG